MKRGKKPLLHIIAKAKNGAAVDLFYYSEIQAAYFNPGLKGFKEVGVENARR